MYSLCPWFGACQSTFTSVLFYITRNQLIKFGATKTLGFRHLRKFQCVELSLKRHSIENTLFESLRFLSNLGFLETGSSIAEFVRCIFWKRNKSNSIMYLLQCNWGKVHWKNELVCSVHFCGCFNMFPGQLIQF